jgi:hypothetical protein
MESVKSTERPPFAASPFGNPVSFKWRAVVIFQSFDRLDEDWQTLVSVVILRSNVPDGVRTSNSFVARKGETRVAWVLMYWQLDYGSVKSDAFGIRGRMMLSVHCSWSGADRPMRPQRWNRRMVRRHSSQSSVRTIGTGPDVPPCVRHRS